VTPEMRARLHAVLADPARVSEVPAEQVAPMVTELVHLLGHLAARLPGLTQRSPEPEPERGVRSDRLLTPEETAGVLGVSLRWLYRHADRLPFTRRLSRKCLRFSESGVYKYLGRAPR
jgi:predicted DNA-binding transcriptional regulator AlpA